MEAWKKRIAELVSTLALGGDGDISVVPYYPQKTEISGEEDRFFPRSYPERHGISSKRIYNMLCELERDDRVNLHNLMVLCAGEVISECSASGYGTNLWHISHSMAKTVCGMLIGTLFDENVIEPSTRLTEVFPEIPYRDKKMASITVEHLLSMTAGVDFAEAGAVSESLWTEAFFNSSVKSEPGKRFLYNSMNSYILARIAERVSGRSFGELCRERIFEPLGIKNYLWEKGPEGTEKAGWGLYMSSESFAKLGVLIADGGSFFGKRILSTKWVTLSTAVKAVTPQYNGDFNYGYQMWLSRRGGEMLFSGMLGQNVWICPRNNIIVVTQCGNAEIFQTSVTLEIVRKHLGGRIRDELSLSDIKQLREKEGRFFSCRSWVRPVKRRRGLLYRLGFLSPEPVCDRWSRLSGVYRFGKNREGLLPIIVRAMQNSFDCTIEEMIFTLESGSPCIYIKEGKEELKIVIGIYDYIESVVGIRGEKYIVKAVGRAYECEGCFKYKIELLFPETASSRRLFITREADKISISFSELPDHHVVENLIKHYSKSNSTVGFLIDFIERRIGAGATVNMIKQCFNPILVGADISKEDYQQVIDAENRRAREKEDKTRALRNIAERLFKEERGGVNSGVKLGDWMKKSIGELISKITDNS